MSIQVAKRPSLSERFSVLDAEANELRGHALVRERELELLRADVTRLQRSLDELPSLREQITKLTKDLENAKNTGKWAEERASKAESELEQSHAVLDGVAGAPPREYEQEYGKGRRNVVTRLAGAFLAIAQKGV